MYYYMVYGRDSASKRKRDARLASMMANVVDAM
jgi:hypothetical protein